MAKEYTLLKISYDPGTVYGNWNYPHMIDNIIVRRSEADIIKTMCENYKTAKTSFYNGRDFFDIPLSDFKIEYIYNAPKVVAFRLLFGNRLESAPIYN
jgi:predicted ester cyclase